MLWSWHKTSHSDGVLYCRTVRPSIVRLLHSSLIGLYAYIILVTFPDSKTCQINQFGVYLSRGRVSVVCTWAIWGESGDRDRASALDVTAAPSTKPEWCTSRPDRPPVKPSVSPIAPCLHLNSLLIAGTRSDEVTKRKTFNLTLKGDNLLPADGRATDSFTLGCTPYSLLVKCGNSMHPDAVCRKR